MVRICEAKSEHFQSLVECQLKVLQSLSELLPEEFIEKKRKRYCPENLRPETLQNKSQLNLMVCENGLIVGFALGRNDGGGNSWLSFLGVHPSFRRMGVGEALLVEFIRKSKILGARRVCLFTAVELKPALKLYIKNGFTTDGVPRYWDYGVDLFKYVKNLE